MALLIEAGQMTASDYVPTYPKFLLASEGASTDVVPSAIRTPYYLPYSHRTDAPTVIDHHRDILPITSDVANGMSWQ